MEEDVRAGSEPDISDLELEAGGVRAFLIADVRGYTRFTQEHGDEAAAALAGDYASVVREVVNAAGGNLLELRGDEALAVFGSPRQAVRASMALRDRLIDETVAHPERPLAVGMGLDVGEAVPVEGGYRGGALNVAARLCSAAAPGEILASREFVHLARRVEGIKYTQLGRLQLKGLERSIGAVRIEPETEDPVRKEAFASALREQGPPRGKRGRLLVAGAIVAALVLVVGVLALSPTRTGDQGPGLRLVQGGVGIVDPDGGEVVGRVPLDGRPSRVEVFGGAVWVSRAAGSVTRIDPDTGTVRQTIRTGSGTAGMAEGAGDIWAANSDEGTVSRIDPETNSVVQTIDVGNGPTDVALLDGRVWVSNQLDGTLSEIDARTGELAGTHPVAAAPAALASDGDSIWVTDEVAGALLQIDPSTGEATQTVRVGNGPNDVEVAAGAVWVANGLDGTVSKVSPGSGLVEATVSVSSGPADLAVDEGIVWVTDRFRGRLTQLDAETGAVDSQTSIGGQPSSIAAGEGRIWVASEPSRAAHRGGTLRLVSTFGVDSIDPSVLAVGDSLRALLITNDGLVGYSRVEGSPRAQLVPDLATSLPVPTDGGKTYTFRLRPGVRYSTGAPVRASDFRRGTKRLLILGTNPTLYPPVTGAGKCERGNPGSCDLSSGITTDDASGTITFHLSRPDPDLFTRLATVFPVPPGIPMEDIGTDPAPATGPYMIDSFEPGESLTMVRNPQFNEWSPVAKPDGYPDRIVWSIGIKGAEGAELVTDGKADYVDLTDNLSKKFVERIQTEFPGRVHVIPQAATLFMFLNTTTAPFDDVRVRRAVNYATDRGEVARFFGAPETATITCQFLPPNSSGFVRYCPYTSGDSRDGTWTAPDLHKARQLIKRSGTSGTPVTVWALKPLFEESGRYFVSLLEDLGYPARLKLMDDAGAYFTKIAETDNDRIQMAAGGWFADGFPGAATMLEVNLCRSFSRDPSVNVNFSSFCDRDVDRLFARAARSQAGDPHAANALWAKVDRLLVDRAPWVGLVNPMGLDFVSEEVGNYEPNVGFLGVWLDQLWVK